MITDEVLGDTVRHYSLAAGPNEEFVLFAEGLAGNASISVLDGLNQRLVASVFASPSGPNLENNSSDNFFTGSVGQTFQLIARAVPNGTTARFRFLAYRVNRAPEIRPPVLVIGDTVSGETIEPAVDADEFTIHGQANDELVIVLETPGAAGLGAVGLIVVGATDGRIVGVVDAIAGAVARSTGRFRLPLTQDYRVIARSVISNTYPRYHGPYRFWSYQIHRQPERHALVIAVNTEIAGESIDRAGDVDEFAFQTSGASQFNVFMQAARRFQLEVTGPDSSSIAAMESVPADSGLYEHATGRFLISTGGTYGVRVSGLSDEEIGDTGAYRFYVYRVDPAPEHVAASITPNDTVSGESIDRAGDVDEFTFSGVAGQEFNVFLQGLSGTSETRFQLGVIDPSGALQRITESGGADTSLTKQPTGRFALTSSGIYRLRVAGQQSHDDRDVGDYRLLLYRVNRLPETVPSTLALGDSISTEALDMPGDVDEYRVVVTDSTGFNLLAQLDEQPLDFNLVRVDFLDSTGTVVVGLFATTTRMAAGRIRLAPGIYTLRVDGLHYQERPSFGGKYRLWIYGIDYGPELIGDTIVIGDTVRGETIDRWGDLDEYRFYGQKDQHINMALQGLADTTAGGFEAWIFGPGGEPVWTFAMLISNAMDASLRDHQTMRLDLPVTGWYRIQVMGTAGTQGAYRLLVESLGTAPETASASLTPGDSIGAESIDTPGDWDEFIVHAAPGANLGLVIHGVPGPTGYASIKVFDPDTRETIVESVTQAERVLGPFRVPATGQVGLAVYQPGSFYRLCYDATCGNVYNLVAPYNFKVISINRAPEKVPAVYTLSDTVRGEAISPLGDWDEFSASATPGAILTPFYRLLSAPSPSGSLITLEIIDPASAAILTGTGASLFGSSPNYFTPGSFTVPASGAFIIRVRSGGLFDVEHGTAPYEFFVRP